MSFVPPSPLPVVAELERIRSKWWLLLLMGILLLVVGSYAIIQSCFATVLTVTALGWVLILAGGLQIFSAFSARHWGGFLLEVLAGILYVIVGIILIEKTVLAAEALTLVIAVSLMVSGVFRMLIPLLHQFSNWIWVLLSGLASLILGVMIWRQFPESGDWVIGMFVGIEMIFSGWAWIMLALTLRSTPRFTA
jgi:uncharacterized membrane protein HdeD (DUF308 family)